MVLPKIFVGTHYSSEVTTGEGELLLIPQIFHNKLMLFTRLRVQKMCVVPPAKTVSMISFSS